MPFEVHDEDAALLTSATPRAPRSIRRHVAVLAATLAVVAVPNVVAVAARVFE